MTVLAANTSVTFTLNVDQIITLTSDSAHGSAVLSAQKGGDVVFKFEGQKFNNTQLFPSGSLGIVTLTNGNGLLTYLVTPTLMAVTAQTNPVTGRITYSSSGILGMSPFSSGSSIAFYGDSLTEKSANYLTPTTVQAFNFGTPAFWVKGTELNCPSGVGTLTLAGTGSSQTLTWAAFGESAGVTVPANVTGLLYVPSSVDGHGIYLDWFGSTRTYTAGSVSVTAKAAGFNLRQYQTNGIAAVAMAFALQSLKIAGYSDTQNGGEAYYGLGGATSTEFLAASQQWSAIVSDIAVLCIGQNDGPNSYTAAQTIAAIKASIALINASKIVICTLPPRNADSANQKKIKQQVNLWINNYCNGSYRFILFDLYAYLADPTTGDYVASYSTDNVHPSGSGGISAGKALGALLLSLIYGSRPPLRQSFVGLYDATYNPYGSLFPTAGMGTFEGAGGTAGTGSVGVAPPTGWRVRRTTGAAATATGSKVARTDVPGNEWQLSLASAAVTEVFTIDTGVSLSSNLVAGMVVEAYLTMNIVANTGLTQLSLQLFENGTGTQVTAWSNADGTIVSNLFTGKLIIKVPQWTIPVGFTSISFNILLGIAAGATATVGLDDVRFNQVLTNL